MPGGRDGWIGRLLIALIIGALSVLIAWSLVADGKKPAAVAIGVAATLAGAFVPTLVDSVRRGQERRGRSTRELRAVRVGELDRSVAWLLHPEQRVIDFFGRFDILDALRAWCNNKEAAVVRLVAAPAGYGKTRLALRLRDELLGWECWRVAPDREAATAGKLDDGEGPDRLLLIVDYADSRPPAGLAALLVASARRRDRGRVRVLLLARTAGLWWSKLSASYEEQATLIDSLTVLGNVIELPARADQRTPHEIVTSAADQFAAHLRCAPPRRIPVRQHDPNTPLLRLHAEALVAVLGGPRSADGRHDVVDEVLSHETRYWRRCARRVGLVLPDDPEEAEALMRRVAGLAALLGADDPDQITDITDRAFGASSGSGDGGAPGTAQWVRWLRTLYPADDAGAATRSGDATSGRLGLLQPDLLAEYLAVEALSGCAEAQRTAIFTGLTEAQATQALTVLGRARAHHPEVEALLDTVLAADVRTMAYAVVSIAPQFPGLLAPRLLPLLDTARLDLADLYALAGRMLSFSVELHRVAVALTDAIVARHTEETPASERARWLANHAARLALTGQDHQALPTSAEAVHLYRELAATNPDAHLPNLAMSLRNHALRLAEAGQHHQALTTSKEAVHLYRELAATNPDAHLPNLAMSLDNHAFRLAQTDKPQQALTTSEEALRFYRRLAAINPDTHLPDLASSLISHAFRLAGAGQHQEALTTSAEAVRLYRELAAANPDAHLPILALSLGSFGTVCWSVDGHRDRGIAAFSEAGELLQKLVASNPEVFGGVLHSTAKALAGLYEAKGDRAAADKVRERYGLSRPAD